MKKKSKVIILSSVVAGGAVVAAATLIPTVLKNKNSKNTIIETKDIKNPIINKNDDTNSSTPMVDLKEPVIESSKPSIDQQATKKFKLSFKELNEKSKDKATFKFYDKDKFTEKTDEVEASFEDKVYFKVEYTDSSKDTILTDLRVYVGTEAWSLGVYYDSDKDIYEITIPSEDSDWAKEFLKDKGIIVNLEFKAYFGPKKINDWTYDFNSRTYAIEIVESMITDAKTRTFVLNDNDEKYKLKALEDDQTYIKPTQFRIYLSGFNIEIENLTIPEKTQLMFINESEYSNTLDNRPAPTISLKGGYRKMDEQLKIKGAIGRYGDVEYSRSMQAVCGLPVILEHEDMDWNWIQNNNKK